MSTHEENRVLVALAIERMLGRTHLAMPEYLVDQQTERFSEETCAVLASTISTKYEDVVMNLSYGGMHSDVISEFVRLAPKLPERAQWHLQGYLKNIVFHRDMDRSEVLSDYYADSLHELIESAQRYRKSSRRRTLPCTTSEERLLIDTVDQHPEHTKFLLTRIAEGGVVDAELIAAVISSPARALNEGLL